MMRAHLIETAEFESEASRLGIALPIEQTQAWARYQATIDGRTPWGLIRFSDGDETLALASLIDYRTHGYHYLRGTHAPVWVGNPTPEQEAEALEALRELVRHEAKNALFVRLAVNADLPICSPTLSSVPYNQTVIIDLSGGDEAILSRMKPRGRRDVRKALRESPAVCADETDIALESFGEHYDVMRETGERDGFAPAPCSDYEDMIRTLGPEHCRVYAGRVDGRVVTWSIVTIAGSRAVRYYGASRSDTMRLHVTDKLVYFECCDLAANKGCSDYDMMGIGNDFAPTLKGLNEFKTKFSKEVADVAPDRDLPIKPTLYRALWAAKRLRDR